MVKVQKPADSSSLAEDDLTRLTCEIQRASGSLEHVTAEMGRAVARLQSILANEAAGPEWPGPRLRVPTPTSVPAAHPSSMETGRARWSSEWRRAWSGALHRRFR